MNVQVTIAPLRIDHGSEVNTLGDYSHQQTAIMPGFMIAHIPDVNGGSVRTLYAIGIHRKYIVVAGSCRVCVAGREVDGRRNQHVAYLINKQMPSV